MWAAQNLQTPKICCKTNCHRGPPLHAPMCSLDHVCTGPAAHNCPKQGLSLRPTWASEFRIRCFYPKMMPQMRLQPELADGFFERLLSTLASREASRMKTSGRNSNPNYPQVINIYSIYIYVIIRIHTYIL